MQKPPEDIKPRFADIGQLDRVESRQVRLVISIPALLFLFTLLLVLLAHFGLNELADRMPKSDRRAEMEHVADSLLVFGIGGSFAAGIVGVLLAWQIVRPLRGVIASMRLVATGDLSRRTDVPALGEIGQLGSVFNRMVDQLNGIFEQRDRQMREGALGTVVTLDAHGRVLATDATLKKILGFEPDQLYGHVLAEAIASPYVRDEPNANFAEALRRCMAAAAQGLTSTTTATFSRRGADQAAVISIRVSPLDAAGMREPAYLVDMRDMTAMAAFYEQMQRADRLAAVGTLATGIAHEIRNPLASIRMMTQLMAEDAAGGRVSPSAADYLDRILREVDRLDRLVREIRDFGRTEETPVTELDFNEALVEAYEVARAGHPEPPPERLEVVWQLDRTIPKVPVEPTRMHQALVNLVANALEELAGRPHGGRLELRTLRSMANSKRPIVVAIRNTGDPIPAERREMLFEPFYTTKLGGTGLGLPIAYQIVVTNGGTMELDCADGMVEFRLSFPVGGRDARAAMSGSGAMRKLLHISGKDAGQASHSSS